MLGLRDEFGADLDALQRVGIRLVVALNEECDPKTERFARSHQIGPRVLPCSFLACY